jgi:hypothetical protein
MQPQPPQLQQPPQPLHQPLQQEQEEQTAFQQLPLSVDLGTANISIPALGNERSPSRANDELFHERRLSRSIVGSMANFFEDPQPVQEEQEEQEEQDDGDEQQGQQQGEEMQLTEPLEQLAAATTAEYAAKNEDTGDAGHARARTSPSRANDELLHERRLSRCIVGSMANFFEDPQPVQEKQ